ncbi:hypothetical protein D3C87_1661770 [compost metagenome]
MRCGKLQAHLADQRVGRGVELQNAAFRCHAGIPGDDLDAALRRLFQRRNHGVRVIGGNGDGIHALRDQRIDDLDLAFRSGAGRARIDDLDATEVFCSLLRALVGGFEKAIAK